MKKAKFRRYNSILFLIFLNISRIRINIWIFIIFEGFLREIRALWLNRKRALYIQYARVILTNYQFYLELLPWGFWRSILIFPPKISPHDLSLHFAESVKSSIQTLIRCKDQEMEIIHVPCTKWYCITSTMPLLYLLGTFTSFGDLHGTLGPAVFWSRPLICFPLWDLVFVMCRRERHPLVLALCECLSVCLSVSVSALCVCLCTVGTAGASIILKIPKSKKKFRRIEEEKESYESY